MLRHGGAAPGRILVAEDFPGGQVVIAFHLRKTGAEVEFADDGEAVCRKALEALRAGRPFDVILMDIQMPILDGLDATRRLRSAGYRGPIVALTAHTMEADRQEALAAGCDAYATKPIEPAQLLATIRPYLAHTATPADAALPTDPPPSPAPGFQALVARFAAGLPARATSIEDLLAGGDLEATARLAHQLKGTAGAYGFADVSDAAAGLEASVAARQALDVVRERAARVTDLCRRAAEAARVPGESPEES